MQRRSFERWSRQLCQLSQPQRDELLRSLQSMADAARTAQLIEAARRARLCCPRCGGLKLRRHGHANGLQRFRCAACGRTFNALTGTPLARLRKKALWPDFCARMLDAACTVRRAADAVGVHRNTSFRWRHRMLEWSRTDRPPPLTGIAEADELYILESQKGARRLNRPARRRGGTASKRGISHEQVCVLVARCRGGHTHDAVSGTGPVTKAQLHRCLARTCKM